MADIWTPQKRGEVMALVKSKGNKSTEAALARLFRAEGVKGWRRHLPLPGKPDFCFPGARVAVFVDGCFWHGCPEHYRRPKTNRRFWDEKRERNMARDQMVSRELRACGYVVIRVFEHELRSPGAVLAKIAKALDRPRRSLRANGAAKSVGVRKPPPRSRAKKSAIKPGPRG
jgi:DNA mismatch endonuclease (patch repair protein)